MKKLLFLLMFLAATLSATNDFTKVGFWQQDKCKHFTYSAGIAGVSAAIARSYGSNKFEAFWIGFGTSMVAGMVKEIADGHGYGHEDIGDAYADMLGAGAGAILAMQWSWRF